MSELIELASGKSEPTFGKAKGFGKGFGKSHYAVFSGFGKGKGGGGYSGGRGRGGR